MGLAEANFYAVGSVDQKGRFPIGDQIRHCYAVEKVLSIPTSPIEQSDPHMPSKKSTFSTGCADRVARSKKFSKPTASPTASLTTPQRHDHTLQQLRCWHDCYFCCCCCCCCCCSQRVSVAHPVLRPPAARTVIRWQQCVLSMTFLQHRCCSSCCARFGDSRRSPTPQPRR